jgi:hypothetical protein
MWVRQLGSLPSSSNGEDLPGAISSYAVSLPRLRCAVLRAQLASTASSKSAWHSSCFGPLANLIRARDTRFPSVSSAFRFIVGTILYRLFDFFARKVQSCPAKFRGRHSNG